MRKIILCMLFVNLVQSVTCTYGYDTKQDICPYHSGCQMYCNQFGYKFGICQLNTSDRPEDRQPYYAKCICYCYQNIIK